jgi:hypothetical protein
MEEISLEDCTYSDSMDEMELGPEAHTLFEAIREVTPLLRQQVDAYVDLRRKIVRQNYQKPILSAISTKIFEQESDPSCSKANIPGFRKSLAMIGQLLQQLAVERAGALRSSEETIRQLQSENAELNRMLAEYRQRELDELKGSDSQSDDALSAGSSPRFSPHGYPKPARRSTRVTPSPRSSPRSRSGSRVSFSPREKSNGSTSPHVVRQCA